MIILLSDELYRDHTPVCPSCLHHPRVQDLCLCRAAACAQLHGVTELWRGARPSWRPRDRRLPAVILQLCKLRWLVTVWIQCDPWPEVERCAGRVSDVCTPEEDLLLLNDTWNIKMSASSGWVNNIYTAKKYLLKIHFTPCIKKYNVKFHSFSIYCLLAASLCPRI